jgi:hypothetical protein
VKHNVLIAISVALVILLASWAPAQLKHVQAEGCSYDTATVIGQVSCMEDSTWEMESRPPIFSGVTPGVIFSHYIDSRHKAPQFKQRAVDAINRYAGQAAAGNSGDALWPGTTATGWYPPDLNLAVGPNHVVLTVNTQVEIYTRTGSKQFSQDLTVFFSGIDNGNFKFDPRCFYDQYSGRFFVLADALNTSTNQSYVDVAVSDDSDPNGNWKKYSINMRVVNGNDTLHWCDYPGFGYGPDSVQITGNMFPVSSGGLYAQVVVIRKAEMLAFSNSLVTTYFVNVKNSSNQTVDSMQPSRHFGPTSTPYLVSNINGNRVDAFRVNNPGSNAPTLSAASITIAAWGGPPSVRQKITSPRLDAIDDRVMETSWRNNHLYATWNINGGTNVANAKWVDINTSSFPTLSVTQQGSAGSSTMSHWMGAITSNKDDAVCLAASMASTTQDPAVGYVWRKASDAPGTMQPYTVMKQGGGYTGEGGTVVRWGDYSGVAVDPNDDRTFWGFNMHSAAASGSNSQNWATWVWSFDPGGGSTPKSYAPTSFFVPVGILQAGGLSALANSDNTYLTIGTQQYFAVQHAWLEAATVVDAGTYSKMDVKFELNSTIEGYYVVQIFNWNTGNWDYLYDDTVGAADFSFTSTITSGVTQYIDSGNNVKMRIARFNGNVPFKLNVDQVQFTLYP